MVIQGENDPYGTLAQVESTERSAGGAVKKLVFPNCGHSPHIDCRQQTIDVIDAFVRDVDNVPELVD